MITTEAEYDTALDRLYHLMGSFPGTPEEAELLRLLDEIEAYEEKHHPLPKPGEKE